MVKNGRSLSYSSTPFEIKQKLTMTNFILTLRTFSSAILFVFVQRKLILSKQKKKKVETYKFFSLELKRD